MRRFAALVAAVALVAGAIALRTYVIDPSSDDDDGGGSGGGGPRVACSSDLADVCEAVSSALPENVSLDVVDPGEIADGTATAEWDAWLTSDVWADIVSAVPDRPTPLLVGDPLAAAEMSMISGTDTDARLIEGCDGRVEWTCLSAATGGRLDEGAPLIVGLGPTDATDALLAATAVTTAVTGDPDIDIVDLETSSTATAVRDALEDLATAPDDVDHLATFLARPSRYDAAAGLAARAALENSTRQDGFVLADVTPTAAAGLVVVATDDDDGRTAAAALEDAVASDDASEALSQGGWDRDASSLDDSSRPRPAVMARIRAVWKEVNR